MWCYKLIALFLGCSFFFFSCESAPKQVEPAFYHWQTKLTLEKAEINYLEQLKVEKLYVKFFDVDWDYTAQAAFPLARVQLDSQAWKPAQMVPTIFITNRTLKEIASSDLDTLAFKIYHQIKRLKQPWARVEIPEIQIDCDWTTSTQQKYFSLLEKIKRLIPVDQLLSATIRLHQVKFVNQTGVPPVDRGMLMFYNVGNVEDWNTENSILALDIAEQYLYNFETYPLALDIALPIFSWGVLFRQGRMIKLISPLNLPELKDSTQFKPIEENRFELKKSSYFKGYYLYEGDWIRQEHVSVSELKESASMLRKVLKNNDLSLSFYHLDTATIKNYSYEQLEAVRQILEGRTPSN